MSADTESLATVIGSRVRQERSTRGWTLDRLADLAGLSRRMLINVEHGVANPSLGTLLNLSEALGVGLPTLVEPPKGLGPKITRAGDGPTLWTGDSGGQGVLVAATEPPDVIELWDWKIEAGETHTSPPHLPGTRELVLVLAGELTLTTGDETLELNVGDALSFAGDQPHSYANSSSPTTRFSLTVFEPGVGQNRRKGPHT